ncbi:MAG: type II toxin-antitoxin system prevent-host-death family antitoxin [Rhizobiaceae bacterium]|nr:type II toxin-antitoxin system prevent-host-death family antitoxin [Rhizobiaceae bacterium]
MAGRTKDAQDHLGDVIDKALREGPQKIVRADDVVVVVDAGDDERLVSRRSSLKDLLFNGPSVEGLDLSRDRSPSREIDFGGEG